MTRSRKHSRRQHRSAAGTNYRGLYITGVVFAIGVMVLLLWVMSVPRWGH